MTNENKESNLEKKTNLVVGAYGFGKRLSHCNPIFRGLCYFGAFVVSPLVVGAIILSPNKQIQQQIFYHQSFQKYDLNKDRVLDSTEFIKFYNEKK